MKDLNAIKAIPINDVLNILTGIDTNKGNNPVCPLCYSGTKVNMTSAFKVYRKTNSWFCFSCSQGGDVIRLVEKVCNVSFRDACEYLETKFVLNPQKS